MRRRLLRSTLRTGAGINIDQPAWNPETDLNEKVWLDWDPADLTNGAVATWADGAGAVSATQATGGNQPTKDSTGVVFSSGTKNLVVPNQSTTGRQHAFVAVFKAAVATATSADGALFSFNGSAGSAPHRSPAVFYDRGADTYNVFRSMSDYANTFLALPAGDDANTHVIVSRVVDGVHYASIDGGTELVSTSSNVVVERDNLSATGIIGDYNATTIDWTLKRLMILQGEISADEVARIQGWAKATYGATLAGGHPYFSSAPRRSLFVNDFVGNTLADWVVIDAFWDHASPETTIEQNYGDAIAPLIAGLSEVFRDDFTSDTTRDDDTGTVSAQNTAQWFTPVQDFSSGDLVLQKPGGTPDVISQTGSELTISLVKSGDQWYSTNLTSINRDGRGNTWNQAAGPIYFEVRYSCDDGGEPAWPSFWVKDANEFNWRTVPRTEIDVIEAYGGPNGDPDGHHQSLHTWPATRTYAGRIDSHEFQSNYTGLTGGTPWGAVELFDGAMHTYGLYIDEDWLIYTFDGLELMRAPSRPDMFRPLYILLSLWKWEASATTGTATMTFDWVRVLQ
jgi:hypothetical protein